MKKFLTITGIIETIIGFIMFISTQLIISVEDNYTWTKPYTQFEAQVLIFKIIGTVLLIWGIINLVMVAVSKYYLQKTEKDVNAVSSTSKICPKCGLSVHKSTTKCPKCQQNLN